MKLSGELDYRIRYDVEHDLFHAQNVFNDEYIKPTFIEYVQKLEKENAELIHENARLVTVIDKSKSCGISPLNYLIIKNLDDQLTKSKQFIRDFLSVVIDYIDKEDKNYSYIEEGWKFLNEVDK